MIISASRRTDIPAFYTEWFLHRLEERYVLVRNPVNPRLVSRISLLPDAAEFIVFWTKNPAPMLEKLDAVDRFLIPYYFLYTVTPYGRALERNLPGKHAIIESFLRLSDRIGRQKTLWRYDPIIFSESLDEAYHKMRFENLCMLFEGKTERCIISYLDIYKKCGRNLEGLGIREPGIQEKMDLAGSLVRTAAKYGITVQSCAETHDLSAGGVKNGKCIDDDLISQIVGNPLKCSRDKTQRARCRCVESVDIGAYDTCMGGCLYCYANRNAEAARRNHAAHDPASGLLFGDIGEKERIVDREMRRILI